MSVIALEFRAGTRTTTTLPLSDPESGVALCDGGNVVSLELRWPDDPAVTRPKYEWLAVLAQVERELKDDAGNIRADIEPARQAKLLAERDDAMTAYAAALVASWSVSDVPCTPASVRDLFARAPFTLALVLEASGDADRFLPESLRSSATESAPVSEAVA